MQMKNGKKRQRPEPDQLQHSATRRSSQVLDTTPVICITPAPEAFKGSVQARLSYPTCAGHCLQNNQTTHLKHTFKLSSDSAMFSEERVHLGDGHTCAVDERMPSSAKLSQTNII